MPPEAAALSCEELDALQELMNIAFGQASAAVAEASAAGVGLTVPAAQVMPAVLLRYYVGAELKGEGRVALLEQSFRGELEGSAFLVLPDAIGEADLRRVGGVLVRACVERLAELLKISVQLDEARVAVEGRREAAARADVFQKEHPALILGAAFHLEVPPATGHVFLACSPACLRRLPAAIAGFLAQYA